MTDLTRNRITQEALEQSESPNSISNGRSSNEIKRKMSETEFNCSTNSENRKRRRSLPGGGDSIDDDVSSSSGSDRPQSTSDSREEGSSSNNSGEENEGKLPMDHYLSSTRKKYHYFYSTSSKSATTSSRGSISQGAESSSGSKKDESSMTECHAEGSFPRGTTSDFTSKDSSSSDSGSKQQEHVYHTAQEQQHQLHHHGGTASTSRAEGSSNDDETSRIKSSGPSVILMGRRKGDFFSEELSFSSDVTNLGQSQHQSQHDSSGHSSQRRPTNTGRTERRSSNNTSNSDIDAIIQRAQCAWKSSESSSFSDEMINKDESRASFSNGSTGKETPGIRQHKGLVNYISRKRDYKECRSSCSSSAISSKGGSNDESGGSLNTSCLDGITSEGNVGDGGLSSSYCSGGDNGYKDSESSGSSSDSDALSSKKSQVETSVNIEPSKKVHFHHITRDHLPQGTISEPPSRTPSTTTPTSSSTTPLEPQSSSSTTPVPPQYVLNPVIFTPPPLKQHHALPVYLDYCLMKRMEAALTNSQESQKQLNEWDTMMGLKSSHSYTMTRSTRSRKKLHNLTKKWLKKLGDK